LTLQRLAFFEETCQEVLKRLERDPSPEATALRTEAHTLLTTVKSWTIEARTSDERADTVSKVLDLHRRTMEHVTATGAVSGFRPATKTGPPA